jgi:hypothetical protein
MNAPFAINAIYCDDIRNEIGDKLSFMGVYDSEMTLQEFPAQLPKFCIQVKVQFNGELPPKSVKISIRNGETVISETVLDEVAIGAHPVPQRPADTEPEDFFLGMAFMFVHTPFTLEAPTTIRVWGEVDGLLLKANGLRVTLQVKPQQLPRLQPAQESRPPRRAR